MRPAPDDFLKLIVGPAKDGPPANPKVDQVVVEAVQEPRQHAPDRRDVARAVIFYVRANIPRRQRLCKLRQQSRLAAVDGFVRGALLARYPRRGPHVLFTATSA